MSRYARYQIVQMRWGKELIEIAFKRFQPLWGALESRRPKCYAFSEPLSVQVPDRGLRTIGIRTAERLHNWICSIRNSLLRGPRRGNSRITFRIVGSLQVVCFESCSSGVDRSSAECERQTRDLNRLLEVPATRSCRCGGERN